MKSKRRSKVLMMMTMSLQNKNGDCPTVKESKEVDSRDWWIGNQLILSHKLKTAKQQGGGHNNHNNLKCLKREFFIRVKW
jgi:hypothetical protein